MKLLRPIDQALLVLTLAAFCAAAEPVPRAFFGMTLNDPPQHWPEAGFGALRLWDSGTSWKALNPQPGTYDWSNLDQWLELSAANHVDVLYVFGRTPVWASSEPGLQSCAYGAGQCAPPANIRDWENFVRAIVKHSAGRVHAWELWNEANTPEGWQGDMRTLAMMSRIAYNIIKEAQPDAIVLTPSATGLDGPEWMQTYLSEGGAAAADAIAFHGYCCVEAPEEIAELIRRYQDISASFGKKPLWDTEASWGKSSELPEENARVSFVARYYAMHWSAGVARFYWYAWDNKDWGTLASADQALPSGIAYSEIAKWLTQATLIAPCSRQQDIWRCDWSLADGALAILAWSESSSSFRVPDEYVKVLTLEGEMRSASTTEQLGPAPVLFVAEPKRSAGAIFRGH